MPLNKGEFKPWSKNKDKFWRFTPPNYSKQRGKDYKYFQKPIPDCFAARLKPGFISEGVFEVVFTKSNNVWIPDPNSFDLERGRTFSIEPYTESDIRRDIAKFELFILYSITTESDEIIQGLL